MSCNKIGGKKKGGNGAAEYGSYVWGKGSDQHAVSPDTNIIAVVNDPAKYTGDNKMVGGSKGGDLTTIGVPAVLIAANQLYKRKRINKTTRRSRSRSRKMKGGANDLDNMMEQSNTMMKMMTPTTMPAVVYSSSNSSAPAASNNVQVFRGGDVRQTGAGILTDIAVPAVLITANQMYKRKTRKNKNIRKHRRSRKVVIKRKYMR
jgi:hypothetical protein